MELLKKQLLWFMREIPLSEELSDQELDYLQKRMVSKTYEHGEKIYTDLRPANRIYFLQEGLIKIGALSETGREVAIEIISKGDLFGALPGIENRHQGFAEAVEKSVVSSIDAEEFGKIISTHPKLCSYFVNLMGEKTFKARKKLEDIVFLDVQGRLARVLLELAEKVGAIEEGKNSAEFSLKITHKDLASMAATTRETTTAVLGKFKKAGIAEVERGKVVIKDIEKLKSFIIPV